jgi:predicted amidophosphoribosyltransferase
MRNAFKAGKHYDRALQLMVANGYDHAPFLGPEVFLVPVPRRAPMKKGDLWPSAGICEELVRNGYGVAWAPLIERLHAVPASSGVTNGASRPSPEVHYASFGAVPQLITATSITLVDDFVTRGSTQIGAATRLLEAYPDREVRAFGLARTISYGEIPSIEMPCDGIITYTAGTNMPHREP